MSKRVVVEFNNDFINKIDEDQADFSRELLIVLNGGDADNLRLKYGAKVVVKREHYQNMVVNVDGSRVFDN